MVATYTSGTVYQAYHTFGNWIVDLWRDRLKGHREGMKGHRPICRGTSCIFLLAFWHLQMEWWHYHDKGQNPLLLLGGKTEQKAERGTELVTRNPFPLGFRSQPQNSVEGEKGRGVKKKVSQTMAYIMFCVSHRESVNGGSRIKGFHMECENRTLFSFPFFIGF